MRRVPQISALGLALVLVGVIIAPMPSAKPATSGHLSWRFACSMLTKVAQAAVIENSVVNQ